jgi:hypothetical protein
MSPHRALLAGTAALLLSALLLLPGCGTPSVHGVATAENQVRDERIVGSWRQDDDSKAKTTYTISAAAEGYRLHIGSRPTEKDEKPVDTDLELRLAELGAFRFIDVTAGSADVSRSGEKFGTLLIPTHLLARVEVHEGEVTVWWLKPDRVRQAMTDRSLPATPLDDKESGPVLITAETPKLQAFLRAHAENEEAWDRVTLRRVKTTPAR